MRRRISGLLLASLLLGPGLAAAQEDVRPTRPDRAAYITREQIEAVNASPGVDRNIRVVDIGHENFAVGVVHRGRTEDGVELNRPRNRSAQSDGPCGRQLETIPEGGFAAGITHEAQTEGYLILSGGGTMFTDGHLVNGRHFALADLNGPTCIGTAYDVMVKSVKQGDVIIIPAGVVHGWIDIPDHVDYLTFRPSPGILSAGWVHPAIRDETTKH